MIMHRFAAIACSIGVGGAALAAAAAQPAGGGEVVDLRPKFEQGQLVRYVMTVRSDNTVRSGDKADGDQKQELSQEFTLAMKTVKTDAETGATVEITFERVKVNLKTDDIDVRFDSDGARQPATPAKGPKRDAIDDAMDDVLKQAFQGMVGQKLTVVYDGQGNIKSVEGGAGLALPGLMDKAGGGAAINKDAGGLFGPIGTKKSGGGKVKVGEKWQNVDDLDLTPFGQFRMVTDYQVRSARDGKAEVFFTGRPEASTAAPGNSPVSIKNGGYTGKFIWDTRLGQLKSMTSEQTMVLEGNKGGIGGMSSKQTVTVERVEKKR